MKIFKKNENFSTVIFIMTSLFALFIFLALVFVLGTNIKYGKVEQNSLIVDRTGDKIFLNKDYKHNDPYITKIPNLRDMLAGPIITNLDPSLGSTNAFVNLVIFSDFECKYCAKQEKILKDVLGKYNLRLIWKDYPASDTSSMSFRAAVAARCAQVEGAFWDYHDLLFADDNINNERLVSIAEDLHLDMDDFSNCLDNSLTAQLVLDNMLEAEALGIEGIPFLYVNDQEVLGEISKKDLEKLIKIEMEDK